MDGGTQRGVGAQRGRWVAVAGVALTVVALAGLGISAAAWGSQLDADGRLLPGATVAGVTVGGLAPDEARAEVLARVEPRLDHQVRVAHGARSWTVTPRDLGATTDLDAVLHAAASATSNAGIVDLVRLRWLGHEAGVALEVSVDIDPSQVTAFVQGIADEVDREPADATLRWVGDVIEVGPDVTGERVDTDAATDAVLAALDSLDSLDALDALDALDDPVALDALDDPVAEAALVNLPVDEPVAEITLAAAEAARPVVQATIDAALDRRIILGRGSASWSVSGRELGAVPDPAPAIRSGLYGAVEQAATTQRDGGTAATLDVEVPLELPDEAVDAFVAEVAGSVDVAARDAQLSWSSTGISITAGQAGLAVDRAAVADRLRSAFSGHEDAVEVTTVSVQPARTAASYSHVLVVRQSQRVVELYRDGVRTQSWPVAVGTGGSPTPTGTFTVGAKRYEPTWVNPARDRWGRDLPARIGPGPNNPLGLRALNWNRPGGGDTLIRFHGTPNEDSIGEAASNGCVRMFNADVVRLYDLVPSGTTIVSIG